VDEEETAEAEEWEAEEWVSERNQNVRWEKSVGYTQEVLQQCWEEGGAVVLVTDGGYNRKVQRAEGAPRQRVAESVWAEFVLTERGSCGWVMGTSRNMGCGEGGGSDDLRVVCTGGDTMANVRGAAGSSYRSELMSIVSALRELTGLVWRGLRAGAVFHWTDNESICLFMLRRGVASMRSWRDRCCRDLWAEIRGRLNVWARAGGTWCSSWVKGHVDKEEAAGRREVGQRSVAEELNIQADDIATVLLRGEWGVRWRRVRAHSVTGQGGGGPTSVAWGLNAHGWYGWTASARVFGWRWSKWRYEGTGSNGWREG
jgi:hypothetical protein